MIDYLYYCHHVRHEDNSNNNAVKILKKAFLIYINKCLVAPHVDENENDFMNSLENAYKANKIEVNLQLSKILKSEISSESDWNIVLSYIRQIISILGIKYTLMRNDEFIKYQANALCRSQTFNSLNYSYNMRNIEINLDSIHGVKGETHLATLILESYYRTHNIKKVKETILSNKKTKTTDYRHRVHYVAFTRPKGLLCITLLKEHVNDKDIEKLSLDWEIIDLESLLEDNF